MKHVLKNSNKNIHEECWSILKYYFKKTYLTMQFQKRKQVIRIQADRNPGNIIGTLQPSPH